MLVRKCIVCGSTGCKTDQSLWCRECPYPRCKICEQNRRFDITSGICDDCLKVIRDRRHYEKERNQSRGLA